MELFLDTKIEYLKGVGPSRATLLQRELGIFTFRDLLVYYPFRYVDRTHFVNILNVLEKAVYLSEFALLFVVDSAIG